MNLVWISQVVIGLLMVSLGIFVFRREPLRMTPKIMTQVAMLMVISILLGSWLKIDLPLLGPESFQINFDTLPIMFIGMLFGPAWGFLAGFMIDMIQLLLAPTAFPFLGFTFNLMLVGTISGFVIKRQVGENYHLMTQMFVVILAIISIALVWFVPEFRINREMLSLSLSTKVGVSAALIGVTGILLFLSVRVAKDAFSFKFLRIVIICELLVEMVLTSLWLFIILEIPVLLSLVPRVVEGIFMIFVLHSVGYGLAKTLFNKQLTK